MLWCLAPELCFDKFSWILPVLSLLLGEWLGLLFGMGLGHGLESTTHYWDKKS